MMKLLCVLLLAACGQAQTVEGSVINSVTGTGIAGVTVSLSSASGRQGYPNTTDALGHFIFENVKSGLYRFNSLPSPFFVTESPAPRMLQITAGADPVKLAVRLTPLPTISGRVVDSKGDGVAKAQLELWPRGGGQGVETTNAEGKFELHLPPGRYIFSVRPPVGLKPPDPDPGDTRPLVWTQTFYPGVILPDAASKIMLRPGDTRDIELKLAAVPAHAIHGVLLKPDGTGAPDVKIFLGEDPQAEPEYRTQSNSDGSFEFPAVVDREWSIDAEQESDGVILRAAQWIEMSGHDIEGFKLTLNPPFKVQGRVVMETAEGAPLPEPLSVSLVPHLGRIHKESGMANSMLQPATYAEPMPGLPGTETMLVRAYLFGLDTDGAIPATINADGTFKIENVYPGGYRIVATPPRPPFYLAEVRLGATDIGAAERELSSGAAPIMVVYKTNGGSVRGTVEKCGSGAVLLVPADTAGQGLGFIHSVRCDSNDRYEMRAVRPGDYYALAFAGTGPVPTLDSGLLNQATKVTVRPGETSLEDLRAIPAY
jgi:Carboxypeptidase regulatory-like domain